MLGAAVFFRVQWLSRFDIVSGDALDGRLVVYIHEHLFQWLLGHVALASPPFYYPQPHVLGYSDALLLDLVPYAALRVAGLDPFLSHQLTGIALTLLGYVCFIGCLRYAFAVRYPIAIAAALLFVFGNPAYKQHVHANFFAINYVPAIALVALWALGAFPRLSVRLLGGVAIAMILFALLFATAFYPAWFTAVAAMFAAIPAAVCLRRQIAPFARAHARPLAAVVTVAALAFGMGLLPFVWIYGPVIPVHSRSFAEYLVYAPFPQDVIHLSPTNFVWGSVLQLIPENLRYGRAIFHLAITPIVLLGMLAGAWWVGSGGLIDRSRDAFAAIFVMAVAFAFLALWLLTLQIGHKSLFWLAWKFVPGGAAIRAGDRYVVWINPWVVAALAVVLDRMLSRYRERSAAAGRRAALLLSLFLAFLLIEQLNTIPPSACRAARS